ncbi:hypothetical protein DH2020_035981 [Rehmannia glutinosa]|uniref:Uncharacterized protein n=1 Tax=Rehmannia glutinosa TaxID=99300 RepID=A0ABR0V4Y2_REHGL
MAIDNKFRDRPSSSRHSKELWQWLWKLQVPPKVQICVWKMLQRALPVKVALFQRKAVPDPICERCGEDVETIEHALWDCPWSSFFCRASPLRLDPALTYPTASLTDLTIEVAKIKEEEVSSLFVMLLWVNWYARNMRTFQGKDITHAECFQLASKNLLEYHACKDGMVKIPTPHTVAHWQHPREGVFKINSDASIMKGEGSSIGVVIRAHNGDVTKALARKYNQAFAVDIMEAIACHEGLKLAKELQLEHVEAGTDCQLLVHSFINTHTNLTYLGGVIDDIRKLMTFFRSFSLRYIPRSANVMAHLLARFAFSNLNNNMYSGFFPSELTHLLPEDERIA